MKKLSNEKVIEKFAGFDFKARVKVPYNDMANKTFNVYEIVGTRVTIKEGRFIDFNINEVELFPIGYSQKDSNYIRSVYAN